MQTIPRDHKLDATIALLSQGYPYISSRCQELGADAFETRLMLKKVTCALGEDAARMFYHPDRFSRKKAMPPTTLMLLQDLGSVQLRDGEAHRQRKRMFMSLMNTSNVQKLVEEMTRRWLQCLTHWQRLDSVKLHDEVREILCYASCRWAGVPLSETEAAQRTREFAAMIDGAGSAGPRSWRGILLRMRTERWARHIIKQVRNADIRVPEHSALAVIARHHDADGKLLDEKSAAVELLNVIRPTVAVARFITFAALALHEHPECQAKIREIGHNADDPYVEWFVQEVRRFYPFFPFVGGRVRQEFVWKNHHFERGEWVLLDLYGTNHDPRIWHRPLEFRPERFRDWNGSPFNFIPQGAGTFHEGHRCPGERLTIELVKAAVRMLVISMRYNVPEQNLAIDMKTMPAIPASGFVIDRVQRVG